MKKAISIITILLALSLVGCGTPKEQADQTQDPSASASTTQTEDNAATGAELEWPDEFEQWNIPVIDDVTIEAAENRSASNEGFTQGVNVVVSLKKLSKSDLEAYLTKLTESGFTENNAESLQDVIYVYNKNITAGAIDMTIVYSEDTTTITAHNSAAEAEKNASAGGDVNWPQTLQAIPQFNKGRYKETVEMGGGMYTISYVDVKTADLDDYRNALEAAGFQQEEQDGYLKLDGKIAYSVGFTLVGDALQIMAMSQSVG